MSIRRENVIFLFIAYAPQFRNSVTYVRIRSATRIYRGPANVARSKLSLFAVHYSALSLVFDLTACATSICGRSIGSSPDVLVFEQTVRGIFLLRRDAQRRGRVIKSGNPIVSGGKGENQKIGREEGIFSPSFESRTRDTTRTRILRTRE